MNKTMLASLTLGAAVAFAGPAFADKMKVVLDGKSEVPANTSAGKGTADIDYDAASKKLSWKVTYSGLSGPATAAHFHGPAAAGAIGINIEDGLSGGKRQLVSPEQHAAKIKAVRDAAQKLGVHLFINARTDPFLLKFGSPDECLNEAARRAKVYADAGADGIFVPGLTDLALIEKFVQRTPLPVNIMVTQGVPEIPDLARVGVRRVSLGLWPMMAAMRVIEQAAAAVAASKQYGTFLQPKA